MSTQPMLLYVEDDVASIKIMEMIVGKVMGIKSLVVFQGSDNFLKKLDELNAVPDLFLLDIHMKPHTGFELLGMLRAENRFKRSKIVAVTASVMGEEIELLKQNGFDGAIAKPITISAFPDLITRILKGKQVWFVG